MNTIKCKVCETEFLPNKELRYTAKNTDIYMFGSKYYDCFDCIECGCQIVVNTRYSREIPSFLNIDSNLAVDEFKKLTGGI